jgi:hypothetical protein
VSKKGTEEKRKEKGQEKNHKMESSKSGAVIFFQKI